MGRALLIALVVLLAAAPAQAAPRGLQVGFFDTSAFAGSQSDLWLDRAQSHGASIVRVSVSWPGVARRQPARPTDPADPAYDWATTDAFVARARARGMTVLLSVEQAPVWAEARGRPSSVRQGAWRPDPEKVGAFMEAVARRYATQVRHIQLWNEPNLSLYLAPQWKRSRGRWVPDAAPRYRAMLNASHAALRRVDPQLRLVTAGTAPYGDPQAGGRRIMPVRFWRQVMAKRARFHILAHHPYGVGSPRRKALSRDDAAIPDVRKFRRVRGLRSKPIWVTEMSWDSRPADPNGVSEATQARWLSDAFFVLWKQRVSAITWFRIQDQERGEGFASTNQSGIYLNGGRAKLSARAFSFPFACERAGSRMRVWALAPTAGLVTVVDRSGRSLGTVTAGANRVATGVVRRGSVPRARLGNVESLPCQVR